MQEDFSRNRSSIDLCFTHKKTFLAVPQLIIGAKLDWDKYCCHFAYLNNCFVCNNCQPIDTVPHGRSLTPSYLWSHLPWLKNVYGLNVWDFVEISHASFKKQLQKSFLGLIKLCVWFWANRKKWYFMSESFHSFALVCSFCRWINF